MKILYTISKFGLTAKVIQNETTIDIHRHTRFNSTEFRDPEINWPAIGATTIQETKDFIVALNKAIEIAEEFANPIYLYEVTIEFEGKMHTIETFANNIEQIMNHYQAYNIIKMLKIK